MNIKKQVKNINNKIDKAKDFIDKYNIIIQNLPASASNDITFNIEAQTLRQSTSACNNIVTLLKDVNTKLKDKEKITSAVITNLSSTLSAFTTPAISGYNFVQQRLFTNSYDYLNSILKPNVKNNFALNDAVTKAFSTLNNFPDTLSFKKEKDSEAVVSQNLVNKTIEKLNEFKQQVLAAKDQLVSKFSTLFPQLAGISIPPKGGIPPTSIPKGGFWDSFIKFIQAIPEHDTIQKIIMDAVALDGSGLGKIHRYLKQLGKICEKQIEDLMKDDMQSQISYLKKDMVQKYGQNLSQYKPAVEANLQASVKLYSKDKTKPYQELASTCTNMILQTLSFITQSIINIIMAVFKKMLDTINLLFDAIKDYFIGLMGSIEKQWKDLIKPATPPTDLPSLIQWAAAIASLFNKPLAEMGKIIVNFVINMIPIIQLIIKKLVSSKTILTQCAPTLAANAAVPQAIIPSLIKHYIKPDKLGLDISKLEFDASNPAVLINSTTNLIKDYFPIEAITSREEKIKKRVMRDLYCKPPQNFCQQCLTRCIQKTKICCLSNIGYIQISYELFIIQSNFIF